MGRILNKLELKTTNILLRKGSFNFSIRVENRIKIIVKLNRFKANKIKKFPNPKLTTLLKMSE